MNKKELDNQEIVMYKVKDIQSIFDIGRDKAYEIVEHKNFPKIKIGREYFIPKNEFEKWIQRNLYKEFYYKK